MTVCVVASTWLCSCVSCDPQCSVPVSQALRGVVHTAQACTSALEHPLRSMADKGAQLRARVLGGD